MRAFRRWAGLSVAAVLSACGAGDDKQSPMSQAAQRGAAVFAQHCSQCHGVGAASTSTAPTLRGLIGRQVGTEQFQYSPALKAADFVWTEEQLDSFLTDPFAVLPDNQMAFYGLEDSAARADLVAFIAHQSPKHGGQP